MKISSESKFKMHQGSLKSGAISRLKSESIKLQHKKFCPICNNFIDYEHKRNTYCSRSCAARKNSTGVRRHGNAPTQCLACLQKTKSSKAKYCSTKCQQQWQYNNYIRRWKNGEISGLSGGVVSNPIKTYLRNKYNNQCSECGWSKINTYTGKIPLVADHIDGNWENNIEENLRLLCACCDSLTATYCGANKGNGRASRRQRYLQEKL